MKHCTIFSRKVRLTMLYDDIEMFATSCIKGHIHVIKGHIRIYVDRNLCQDLCFLQWDIKIEKHIDIIHDRQLLCVMGWGIESRTQ